MEMRSSFPNLQSKNFVEYQKLSVQNRYKLIQTPSGKKNTKLSTYFANKLTDLIQQHIPTTLTHEHYLDIHLL